MAVNQRSDDQITVKAPPQKALFFVVRCQPMRRDHELWIGIEDEILFGEGMDATNLVGKNSLVKM